MAEISWAELDTDRFFAARTTPTQEQCDQTARLVALALTLVERPLDRQCCALTSQAWEPLLLYIDIFASRRHFFSRLDDTDPFPHTLGTILRCVTVGPWHASWGKGFRSGVLRWIMEGWGWSCFLWVSESYGFSLLDESVMVKRRTAAMPTN